jgi:molybdopterin-guanine dinucleotide biosynthesis protein A
MVTAAGFVLAGGRSSRMGRDKALLPWQGATLLEVAANKVRQATGNVTILGTPELYGHLGFPVLEDLIPDCGPLGGLYTALSATRTDWNLLVACDMPALTVDLLTRLLTEAATCGADALVPKVDRLWQPLCAIYHRRLAPVAKSALDRKSLKMQDLVSQIDARSWPAPDPAPFANLNTPNEFDEATLRS